MENNNSSFNDENTPHKLEEFNSTLKIKLKLPKHEHETDKTNTILIKSAPKKEEEEEDEVEEGEIREEEVENEVPVMNLRICPFCHKGFSNGKALGGHMRVHADNYKPKKSATAATSSAEVAAAGVGGEEPAGEVFNCLHCPKEFPSLKSLFGHMRSHPDRLWRGMRPPQLAMAVDSATAEERLRRLGSWRVTGKRGREPAYYYNNYNYNYNYNNSSSSSSSATTSFTGSHLAEVVAAAELLMLLASDTRGGGSSQVQKDEFNQLDDDVIRANKKGKGLMVIKDDNQLDNQVIGNRVGNRRVLDEDEVYYLKNLGLLPDYKLNDDDYDVNGVIRANEKIIDEEEMIRSKGTPQSKGIKIRKINHNHKINDNLYSSIEHNLNLNLNQNRFEINNVINVNKYVCSTCGKSFSTHQALGGHKSSHNKYNNQIKNIINNIEDNNNNNNIVDDMVTGQTRVMVDGSRLTETGPITSVEIGGDGVLHKCKICDKSFGSGQALGGHQRSHYVPTGQTEFETGQKSYSDLFDLNVEPPVMMEDENDNDNDNNNNNDNEAGDVITFDSNSNNNYC